MAVVLTAVSGRYGYHRDELYFRMLRPAWGYVDQPPFTPWLARSIAVVADQPWALRVPATLLAPASVLVVALVTGLLAVGPRRTLWSGWLLAGAGLALVLALPQLVFQATHDWPQLAMGAALADNNAGEVRVLTWPFLLLMLGLPLVPVWVAGIVALLRRRQWRALRLLVPAFGPCWS
jgi:hypothetical protein